MLLPVCQVLFYFTEDEMKEADFPKKDAIVLLRACDFNALKRLDYIYLENGPEDYYYKHLREHTKFVVMGCEKSFDDCFCVSMGTNTAEGFDAALNFDGTNYEITSDDAVLSAALSGEEVDVKPHFVRENAVTVTIPANLTSAVAQSHIWDEYDKRCIACGRCTLACPTCTCWSMQDVFYTENGKAGERRRVQASCMVDGYTTVAGGGQFRKKNGERMRFKALHKVLDFKKRAGFQMCVGCGRCDAICPEYISFQRIISRLEEGMKEVTSHE